MSTECTVLIFRPQQREPRILELYAKPSMGELESVGDDSFERVPGFFSIEHNGAVHHCVAFALRNRGDQPLNVAATIAWDSALRRDMGIGLMRPNGPRADQLAGPVVVLFSH
jgi:hypothetical protein